MSIARHNPAYAGQIAALLNLRKDDLFLDLTLGDGGHTEEALDAGARVVSLDVDPESISRSVNFIGNKYTPSLINVDMAVTVPEDFRWLIIRGNFKDILNIKSNLKLPDFKAVLADLGTSQYQIAASGRGFSFNEEGPLDMRLDPNLGVTAADLVNSLGENELVDLFLIADEIKARPIARAIKEYRQSHPFKTTKELADLISAVKRGPSKIHPATKVFMALRMVVNLEREALTRMLDALPQLLQKDGLAGIISFHSGEDRLVKRAFKYFEDQGKMRVIDVKPIKPEKNESISNPKIRSALLRRAQKI